MNHVKIKILPLISVAFGIAVSAFANADFFSPSSAVDRSPFAAQGAGGLGAISLFRRIDTNDDGWLSLEEATAARLKRSSYRFRRIDTDHDGLVSSEEYLAAAAHRQDKYAEYGEELFACVAEQLGAELPDPDALASPEERFTGLDGDANGYVSKLELDQFLMLRVAGKFAAADADGDSYISWHEFKPAAEFRMNRRRAMRYCIEELTVQDETLEDLTGSGGVRSVAPL